MRAFVYLRVSTDDKGQDASSQEADILKLRDELCPGAEVVRFSEEASAWQDNRRPVFQEAIKRFMLDKEAKYFLAWDFDRIYRDRRKFVNLMKDMEVAGKVVMTYRQRYLHSIMSLPDGWIKDMVYGMVIQIYGEMAEEESNKRSDRVKKEYEKRKKEGRLNGWGRPAVSLDVKGQIIELKQAGISIRRIQKTLAEKNIKVSIGKISQINKE